MELPTFITSTDISHGSRRLATTLLYGAYVLRPLLDPAQCKDDNLTVIARAVQERLDHWWSASDEPLQPLELAMLVSLFAVPLPVLVRWFSVLNHSRSRTTTNAPDPCRLDWFLIRPTS